MAAAAPAGSQEVSGRAPEAYRVLAFEDNTEIHKLLRDGGIMHGEFKQKWTTECVCRQALTATAATDHCSAATLSRPSRPLRPTCCSLTTTYPLSTGSRC